MILEEDKVKHAHYTVYVSKVDFGNIKKGDEVFVYKTIHGLEDLKVHKGVPIDTDTVHYFFNHELELSQ